jgi:hypothetical protein
MRNVGRGSNRAHSLVSPREGAARERCGMGAWEKEKEKGLTILLERGFSAREWVSGHSAAGTLAPGRARSTLIPTVSGVGVEGGSPISWHTIHFNATLNLGVDNGIAKRQCL